MQFMKGQLHILKKLIQIFILIIISRTVYAEKHRITIYAEDAPPYNFVKNNIKQGITYDIVNSIKNNIDSKYDISEIDIIPWARALQIIDSKKNNAVFPMAKTPARNKKYKWVGPIIDLTVGVIVKKSSNITIRNKEDLSKYKIGIIRGDVAESLLLDLGVPSAKLEASSKIQSLIEKLKKNRLKLIAFNSLSTMWMMKNLYKSSETLELVYVLRPNDGYLAFNLNTSDEIIKDFQDSLNKIKKNGIFQQVIKKYLK